MGYWSAVQALCPSLPSILAIQMLSRISFSARIMGTILIVFHLDLKFSAWLADLIILCLYSLWVGRVLICFPLLGSEKDLNMLCIDCWARFGCEKRQWIQYPYKVLYNRFCYIDIYTFIPMCKQLICYIYWDIMWLILGFTKHSFWNTYWV